MISIFYFYDIINLGGRNMDVYENCPVFETKHFQLRRIEEKDAKDLLEVYSDVHALPLFNSDNCHGSNFYITNLKDMENTIKYWLIEYFENKGFVRFSILDRSKEKCIGTIEMFHRLAEDAFNHCGVLRLDLRSDYEKATIIEEILSEITEPFFDLFSCDRIISKAANYAVERMAAFKVCGYRLSEDVLIGNYRTYYDYWVKTKP